MASAPTSGNRINMHHSPLRLSFMLNTDSLVDNSKTLPVPPLPSAQTVANVADTAQKCFDSNYPISPQPAVLPSHTNAQLTRNTIEEPDWTKKEDEFLLWAVTNINLKYGNIDWMTISSLIPGRTNLDCSSRWSQINPNIKRGEWTRKEDRKLTKAIQSDDVIDWPAVFKQFPDRTTIQIKKRWKTINPLFKQGNWSTVEKTALYNAVNQLGISNFDLIAARVKTRCAEDCTTYWFNTDWSQFKPDHKNEPNDVSGSGIKVGKKRLHSDT